MNLPWSLSDTGTHIITLQQSLNEHGFSLACDGHFGPATYAAVSQFQRDNDLIADGIVGRKTLATLRAAPNVWLGESNLEAAADRLDVDVAAIRAVYAVESNGCGFLEDGRPVILFERHIMHRQLAKHGHTKAEIADLATRYPNLVNKTPGGYRGGGTEQYRLRLASNIDLKAALESCSWGLFQIMGFHWEHLGYESLAAFVTAMTETEGGQFEAFVRFILADEALHQSLQQQDWKTFARIYNGPGYKKNAYHTRLEQHYKACTAGVVA